MDVCGFLIKSTSRSLHTSSLQPHRSRPGIDCFSLASRKHEPSLHLSLLIRLGESRLQLEVRYIPPFYNFLGKEKTMKPNKLVSIWLVE